MELSANPQAIAYLGSAILFILSLKGLTHPATARRGDNADHLPVILLQELGSTPAHQGINRVGHSTNGLEPQAPPGLSRMLRSPGRRFARGCTDHEYRQHQHDEPRLARPFPWTDHAYLLFLDIPGCDWPQTMSVRGILLRTWESGLSFVVSDLRDKPGQDTGLAEGAG